MSDYIWMTKPVNSINPVMSSMAAHLRSYIESNFPPKYFKDYFISTETPKRFRRRYQYKNVLSHFKEIKIPLLSIQVNPIVDWSEYSEGREWLLNSMLNADFKTYHRLMYNQENSKQIKFKLNRVSTAYNITITMHTEQEAYELQSYIKYKFPVGLKVYLNSAYIFSEIPMSILRLCKQDVGLGETEFEEYIKRYSGSLIDKILNPASDNYIYGFYFKTNILCSVTSLPQVNIERDGNTVRNSSISFEIMFDCPVPTSYGYSSKEELPTINEAERPVPPNEYISELVPIAPPVDVDNKRLAFYSGLVTTSNLDKTEDTVDFSPYIHEDDVKAIKLLEDNLDNPDSYYDIVLWDNGSVVNSGWEYDTETSMLYFKNNDFFHGYKYHFGIYIDYAKVKELSKEHRIIT